MLAAPFAGVNELSIMMDIIQHLGVQVEVIYHHIRLLEAFEALNRKEPDISWPCADYVNFSFFQILYNPNRDFLNAECAIDDNISSGSNAWGGMLT